MGYSRPGGGQQPPADILRRLESRIGPLPQFGAVVLGEGSLAAAISAIGAVVGWLLVILIVSQASGASASNSNGATSGNENTAAGIAAFLAAAIASANSLPMRVSVGAGVSLISGSVDVTLHSPPTILSAVVLFALALCSARASRKLQTGWAAGVGVAFVYATVTTVAVAIIASHASISNLGSDSSISYDVSPAFPSAWFYAFFWAIAPALIGATGGGKAALAIARAQLSHPLLRSWRAPIVGSLWALAVSLGGCFLFGLCAIFIAGTTNNGDSASILKVVGVYALLAPVSAIYLQSLGLGSSLGFATDPPGLLTGTKHSVSLLGDWPLTNWAYLLPAIVLIGCVVGVYRALQLEPRRSTAYRVILPLGLLNVLCVWLSGTSASIHANSDLSSLIDNLGSFVGLEAVGSELAQLAQNGVGISFGPSITEVAVGSCLFAALGAFLGSFLFEQNGNVLLTEPARSRQRAIPGSEPSSGTGVSASDPRFGSVPVPAHTAPTSVEPIPTHNSLGPVEPTRAPLPPPARRGIPLASVSSSKAPPPQAPSRRSVCAHCGHISSNTSVCPVCTSPLDR